MLIFNQRHLRIVLVNTFGTTTVDGRTAPATFAHRNQPTPSRTSATNASHVGLYWVA
jgi:hypothetical protein